MLMNCAQSSLNELLERHKTGQVHACRRTRTHAGAKAFRLGKNPVLIIEGLSEGQQKFLRLADNRIALNAGSDEDLLATELQWLVDEGFNVLEAGFSDDELSEMINFSSSGETEPELGDEDAVPEVPIEPEAKTNEIWKLGRHRVMCGDARDTAAVETLLGDKLADMVFTDPPYG